MNVAHFYHAWAGGDWRDPLAEHFAALEAGGFDGPFHVGIAGPPDQRAEVLEELRWIRPPDQVIQADDGWEQVTLRPLRLYARKNDGAVLYAHTKGAHAASPINIAWRRSMSAHLVRGWRNCSRALDGPYDAVGCHWLTREEFGDVPGVPLPCFGGNYWMASCAYLRQLPRCPVTCRHDAEGWVGQADPRVLDLHPGWPGDFGPVKYARLVAAR